MTDSIAASCFAARLAPMSGMILLVDSTLNQGNFVPIVMNLHSFDKDLSLGVHN
jgi:hypothetical protein